MFTAGLSLLQLFGNRYSQFFTQPHSPLVKAVDAQDHALDDRLDRRVLLDLCAPALDNREPVRATLPIRNTDRAVGTLLGRESIVITANATETVAELHFSEGQQVAKGELLASVTRVIKE